MGQNGEERLWRCWEERGCPFTETHLFADCEGVRTEESLLFLFSHQVRALLIIAGKLRLRSMELAQSSFAS